MAQSFHNKGRKNKKFVVALDQVGRDRAFDQLSGFYDRYVTPLLLS